MTNTHSLFTTNENLIHEVIKVHFAGGHSLARKYGMDYEDLVSAGSIGLMKSVHRYDDTRKIEFSTYAYHMIRGEIRRLLRDNNSMVHFSRTTKEYAYKVRELANLSVDTITQAIPVDDMMAIEIIHYLTLSSVSFDMKINTKDGGCLSLSDLLPSPYHVENYVLRKMELEERLSMLTDRERKITQMILDGQSQTGISKAINISQSRISRIVKGSITKINANYQAV